MDMLQQIQCFNLDETNPNSPKTRKIEQIQLPHFPRKKCHSALHIERTGAIVGAFGAQSVKNKGSLIQSFLQTRFMKQGHLKSQYSTTTIIKK